MSVPALGVLLDGYRNTALIAMGLRGGWFRHGMPKAAMVSELAKRLADPEHARTAAARLDPTAREVLALLQQLGGTADADDLYEPLRDEGAVGERAQRGYRYDFEPGNPDAGGNAFQDALARLEVVGLVLGREPLRTSATVTDFGTSRKYAIPAEVAPHLPPAPPLSAGPPPVLAREVPGDPEAFARQQYLVWSYFWRHRPKLLKSGLLGKRDLAALASQLDPRPDVSAAHDETALTDVHFQRRLLEGLYLVDWFETETCQVDEEGARGFWADPVVERAEDWLSAWTSLSSWNELHHLPKVTWSADHVDRRFTPLPVRDARVAVMARIGELGRDGDWVAVAHVVRLMRRTARNFLLDDPATGRQRAHDYGYSGRYGHGGRHRYERWGNAHSWIFDPVVDERQGWERVETAFIRLVVETVHRMGFCDAGLDDAGQLVAFRLNPLGRRLLSGPPGEAPAAEAALSPEAPGDAAPAGARVVVQPNLRILAVGPVPVADLMRLEAFADRVSTDRVLEFALTRASVYRAQLDGQDGAAIVATLEELAGQPVAQGVTRTIEDWQRLHEQVTIHRRTTLFQTDGEPAMSRIVAAADGGGAAMGGEGAGPAALPLLAPVPGSPTLARILDPARVAKALASQGLAPAAPRDRTATGSISWDEDGGIRPRHTTPSLYLLGRLQRLADWDGAQGRWQVTAASAARAKDEHGLDAPAQLEAWTALSASAPPAWLDARLKAWCGHYPPAKLHRVVLLELPSADALADLKADRRAKALARPFKPTGPLLAVDEAELEVLRAVLAEYGIGVVG